MSTTEQEAQQGTDAHAPSAPVPGSGAPVPESTLVPESARDRLETFFAAGWPTPDVPDWNAGGYATKERVASALRLLADYIDQATNHPHARPLEDEPPP